MKLLNTSCWQSNVLPSSWMTNLQLYVLELQSGPGRLGVPGINTRLALSRWLIRLHGTCVYIYIRVYIYIYTLLNLSTICLQSRYMHNACMHACIKRCREISRRDLLIIWQFYAEYHFRSNTLTFTWTIYTYPVTLQ